MIYLETERLILRDYTENDAEEYSRLMADDQVMYYGYNSGRKTSASGIFYISEILGLRLCD